MPKQVQVIVPADHPTSFNMVVLEEYINKDADVTGLVKIQGVECTIFMFRCITKKVGGIIAALGILGIGESFGVIDVIDLTTTKPRLVNKKKKPFQVADRMSIEEIHESVDATLHMTFDFLGSAMVATLIIIASLISSNPVGIVAGMLICPLMGPIMGMTFGTVMRDWNMVLTSARNEFVGMVITFTFGSISGLLVAFFLDHLVEWGGSEMRGSSTLDAVGAILASTSGLAVGFSLSIGGMASMIGIAIATSLLPPLCNAGMNLSYGLVVMFYGTNKKNADPEEGWKWLKVSGSSMLLYLLNLGLIYICALLVFWIKGIGKSVPKSSLIEKVQRRSTQPEFTDFLDDMSEESEDEESEESEENEESEESEGSDVGLVSHVRKDFAIQ
eukprot:TRINITY_DN2709_c0_g1_i1.p1 TRINITY_DN2709_c0_g1~~TRINITY_DN2709_c0_g1_i1.p1  ORF type:complete len:387 (-),score=74.06 TRINITY_DN2709_c0_g1_i1:20-1180(-)